MKITEDWLTVDDSEQDPVKLYTKTWAVSTDTRISYAELHPSVFLCTSASISTLHNPA